MVTGPVVLNFAINSIPGIGAINELMTKMGLPNPLAEILIGGLIGAFIGAMLVCSSAAKLFILTI